MKRILVLTSLSLFIMCCCPLTGIIQMAIEVGQNALKELIGPEPILENESPYPYKTTIDGLTFWLMSKGADYWDPETGDYCGW